VKLQSARGRENQRERGRGRAREQLCDAGRPNVVVAFPAGHLLVVIIAF